MSEDTTGVTIGRLLERAVERFGDREAYVGEDRRLTYSQVAEETDTWARALVAAVVHEPMPLTRLFGFAVTWAALVVLALDGWRGPRRVVVAAAEAR